MGFWGFGVNQELTGVKVSIRFLLVWGHKLHDLISDSRFTGEEFLLYELKEVRCGKWCVLVQLGDG